MQRIKEIKSKHAVTTFKSFKKSLNELTKIDDKKPESIGNAITNFNTIFSNQFNTDNESNDNLINNNHLIQANKTKTSTELESDNINKNVPNLSQPEILSKCV